jgi:probable HAF family extracellular repeat protein
MTDLNAVASSNPANLYLLQANSINKRGEIVGFAADSAGNLHGFLATPAADEAVLPRFENIPRPVLSESVRKAVLRGIGIRGK